MSITTLCGILLSCLIAVALPIRAETVKIGVEVPLTGAYANEGLGIQNAVKLIAGKLNRKGGLFGRQIEIVTCDDAGIPAQAKRCAQELVGQGIIAVIGSYSSSATAASQPIYAQAHVLQTSDAAAEELVLHGYNQFFRNNLPNSAQARFAARYLVNVKHYKRIVVLSDRSNYSAGLGDNVVAELDKLGVKPVYRGFIQADAKSFKDVLKTIKTMRPDAIYFSGYYSDGGRIRAEEFEVGLHADFVGSGANQNAKFAQLAGSAASGAIILNFPAPENLPYPEAKVFLAAYQSAYGSKPPSIYTLANADGMRLIIAAILATESFDSTRLAQYIHQRFHVLPWLHHMQFFPGITGPIGFNSFGDRTLGLLNAFRVNADGTYSVVYP